MFRRRPDQIPTYEPVPKTYQVETVPTQLKIIRTHIAAITGELATLRVQLQQAVDLIREHRP